MDTHPILKPCIAIPGGARPRGDAPQVRGLGIAMQGLHIPWTPKLHFMVSYGVQLGCMQGHPNPNPIPDPGRPQPLYPRTMVPGAMLSKASARAAMPARGYPLAMPCTRGVGSGCGSGCGKVLMVTSVGKCGTAGQGVPARDALYAKACVWKWAWEGVDEMAGVVESRRV